MPFTTAFVGDIRNGKPHPRQTGIGAASATHALGTAENVSAVAEEDAGTPYPLVLPGPASNRGSAAP